MKFKDKLKGMKACREAIDFAGDMTFEEAWQRCERADWMLWYICKAKIGTRKARIHVICDCAETALKYVPKGEDRPRLAIEAARKYANKKTDKNLVELRATGAATWAAGDVARAATWAAWAAGDVAWAAWAAGDAAWAATGAAGDAARAATWAAWAAGDVAWAAALKSMADMIRKNFKV